MNYLQYEEGWLEKFFSALEQNSEWLKMLRLRAALDEALAAVDAAGVRAAALKGPVLAERIYPNPSVRS